MTLFLVLIALTFLVWFWRRLRKARQRRAAAVTAAPMVQAMNGITVTRSIPTRFRGSRGFM